jgi:arabinofuranosyltransferase
VSDGTRLGRRDLGWLVGLLFLGCLTLGLLALTADRFTGGQGGVPLDDAWIHFQFARNLARGDGLSFNPGEPTSGSTAPLWTLLLAGAYLLGCDFPVAGQVLSGACFLAALVATYILGARLTGKRWLGALAGAVVAVNGRMVWAGLSALETCLFAALSLLAINAHIRDRATLSSSNGATLSSSKAVTLSLSKGVTLSLSKAVTLSLSKGLAGGYRLSTAALFGLAALSRPEGYLLFALSLADFLWANWRRSRITHHASRITYYVSRILLPALIFAAIVLPYLLFSLRTSGHLLPNTYHAKAGVDLRPDLDFLSLTARYLILDNPLLLPFYVLGLGVLLFPTLSSATGLGETSPQRQASLLSLWSAGLPLIYACLHAVLYQHGRYLIPLIPVNAVAGVVGLLEVGRLATRRGYRWRGSPRALALLVGVLVIVGTAWRLPTMARLYAWNVDNINEMHVALGEWVAEHTPPDAVLALNDIGAIAYVSERPIVDLAGLVTPEVIPLLRAPDRDARLADFMAEQGVQYVVIFPNWFPGLAARTDVLEPVYQVTLARNTIAGGEMMVVYRAHWRR